MSREQLLTAPYSPYARMVRIVASELGLDDRLELIEGDTWDVPDRVNEANPLGKVPILIAGPELVIYDSRTICDFLCNLVANQTLLPVASAQRARVLTLQALGTGLMDTMIERFLERWRPVELQMPDLAQRLRDKTERCLDYLELRSAALHGQINLGTISVASALSYVSFRFPADDWMKNRPRLAQWYGVFADRPSMRASQLRDLDKK